ncbi:hypothetical protein [Paludisphaera borealis]|uniref:Uncharacterized protein n=1 Tax=Paludisphaera borealis TaxID=1387353 RepID=A0A1U7CPD1_9BACT|nr:hypothetical protein [Paludisphaera borealis]APW60768.1 hypothetical protein BSF38_02257 [Paludisphaera borealis]
MSIGEVEVVGTLVRGGAVVLKEVAATIRRVGNKRRASFVVPTGAIQADDVLHLVTPGDVPRVVALHVDRRIRRRADVEGDPIDARVMGDVS